MGEETDGIGVRPSPDQGSRLARRLVASPRVQEEQERQREDPPPRSTARLKALLVVVGYWSVTVLVGLGALVLMVAAGAVSARHGADLEERAQPGFDARDRTSAAEEGIDGLPGRGEAQRWLLQATTAGESVAAAQNTYLEHAGPLGVGDLPERTPGLGETDECTPYLDDLPPSRRDYTEDERTTCAEGLRESAVGGLERKLTPHFAAGARDSEGFNAVSRWHESVSTLDDDVPLDGYIWHTHRAQVFAEDTVIPLVWILTEDETGRTVAWMRGLYDPVVKKFDDLVFGTVSAVEEDEEGGADPVEDDAEEAPGDDAEDGER